MFQGDNQYGAQLKAFGPGAASVIGENVQYAAVIEFDSIQAAIDFWDDTDYAAARTLMGSVDDESASSGSPAILASPAIAMSLNS